MVVYNIMTCQNLGMTFLGGCTMAWIVLAVLFLLALILSRQITEYNIMPFNRAGAIVGALLPTILFITFTGNTRLAFLIGLVGIFALGYLFTLFLGEGDYE
jgi:hypothetical protein